MWSTWNSIGIHAKLGIITAAVTLFVLIFFPDHGSAIGALISEHPFFSLLVLLIPGFALYKILKSFE